jgi:hypothetical protein
MSQRVMIYGKSTFGTKAVELYKRELLVATIDGKKITKVDVSDIVGKKHLIDLTWLPQASKEYKISPRIEDYVVDVVGVVTSDIPNRNSHGFALKTLTEFDTDHGRLRYKTFVGKSCFVEHKSDIKENAKGVNIDASLLAVPYYGIAKVNVLSAFDRTKDENLASTILRNKRNAYSMGASVTYFVCSICNGVLGPSVTRTCTCIGSDFRDLRTYGKIVGGKLHYLLAGDPIFCENSWVADPADISAIGEVMI